ncbi:PC4-domain-containing protein [Aspergillus filifer]
MAFRSKKRSSTAGDSHDDDELSEAKKPKIGVSNLSATRKEDSNGDSYWEISKMRRVTISSFRGKTMVNIREYYEKDGEELPGKKGISLPIDQFSALLTLLPEIESALQEKGVPVPRPSYVDVGTGSGGNDEDLLDKIDELSESCPSKKNIEATSDEDESEE